MRKGQKASPELRRRLSLAADKRNESASYRAELSRLAKERWADQKWASRQTSLIQKACKTPEHRRNLSIAVSKEATSKEGRKVRSDRITALWSDPVWAANQRLRLQEAWTEERCEQRSEDISEHYKQHPERRRKLSRSRKKLFLDPKFAERHGRRFKESPNAAEKIMLKFLRKLKIGFQFQKSMLGFFPDFTLPSLKMIIECDGEYWHSPLKVRRRDARKDRLFTKAGYKVIRVCSEDVVDRTEEILDQLKKLIRMEMKKCAS
jgi:very-short-patch-repair endonuclease